MSFSLCAAAALFLAGCSLPPVAQEKGLSTLEQDLSECKHQISRLNLKVEELRLILDTHDQTLRDLAPSARTPKPSPPPKQTGKAVPTQAALYQQAYAALSKKQLQVAEERFTSFLKQYPACDLSDNCMYWLGEINYFKKDFHKAIDIFKNLTETYPHGNKRPDALLKIGYSYLNLRDKGKARDYLTRLLKTYPFSPAGSKAEKKLNQLN